VCACTMIVDILLDIAGNLFFVYSCTRGLSLVEIKKIKDASHPVQCHGGS